MGRRLPATDRLAVPGRRGERPHPLSDVPRRCVADACGDDWRRGVGCAPVPSAQDIAALERRTEGWIAGLQLAAISLQGHEDAAGFVRSFTGSHHFVLDYLVEEVLGQQPERIQTFLLRTSILDRLCGPLCDAVVLVPLDNERRWYRYHQLFADLLRQRLQQSTASSPGDERDGRGRIAHPCQRLV